MYWPRFFLDSGIMVSVGSARLGELTVCTDTKITNQSGLTKEAVSRQISVLLNDGVIVAQAMRQIIFLDFTRLHR